LYNYIGCVVLKSVVKKRMQLFNTTGRSAYGNNKMLTLITMAFHAWKLRRHIQLQIPVQYN